MVFQNKKNKKKDKQSTAAHVQKIQDLTELNLVNTTSSQPPLQLFYFLHKNKHIRQTHHYIGLYTTIQKKNIKCR
jgi:hypothetical protein